MSDSFDLGEPPQPAKAEVYRVLARKYRPQTFAELIGQDAMVTTLANAIKRGRLAHAFLLTGVRGVGKTSTARLIAKALNCIGPDGNGGPTIELLPDPPINQKGASSNLVIFIESEIPPDNKRTTK